MRVTNPHLLYLLMLWQYDWSCRKWSWWFSPPPLEDRHGPTPLEVRLRYSPPDSHACRVPVANVGLDAGNEGLPIPRNMFRDNSGRRIERETKLRQVSDHIRRRRMGRMANVRCRSMDVVCQRGVDDVVCGAAGPRGCVGLAPVDLFDYAAPPRRCPLLFVP